MEEEEEEEQQQQQQQQRLGSDKEGDSLSGSHNAANTSEQKQQTKPLKGVFRGPPTGGPQDYQGAPNERAPNGGPTVGPPNEGPPMGGPRWGAPMKGPQ